MRVGVLGPVQAQLDGHPVDLGTPKQRALVASLALSNGRPVSVDAIVDLLWGDSPPGGVTATLQAYVSGLRRVLEPGRERRAPATVLVTVAPGYALRVPDGHLDARAFELTVNEQHRRLAGLATSSLPASDLDDVRRTLDEALALWRGTPYGELGDAPAAVAERARLEELRLVALEDRAVGELALGRHATVVGELEALTSAHPLRERLWALRALALTRSGRQAEALDVLRQIRDLLDEELGIEPSAELRELQTAVLRQEDSLVWVAPAQAPVTTPDRARDQPAGWPMVGRDAELATLGEALAVAESGTPSYAVLTGEPGIGKTRLSSELVGLARTRGVRVLVGRGSQDEGAPPLWPWATVLEGLGAELPEGGADDEGSQFRAREQIARTVRSAAQEQATLVVLDDLHWADADSLRVLRLLADTAEDEQLMVLCTWRSHPEPTGTLADTAETLARRHAHRFELAGLASPEAATVFETVAAQKPSAAQADALTHRTDGNPFFLVEYARLAGARGDLAALLEENPPTAVQEVLTRRLARLPDETVRALRVAAVIGRDFDNPTLARATGIDEDDLLDVVEPAQAAGLVRENGVDRFAFSHALVRDTLYSGLSASRRARAHAGVAAVLQETPGRETELARHWLAAGPGCAAQAWRACLDAAELARRMHAHEQRADLLRAALGCLGEGGDAAERFEVLMQLVDAYRWSAMWPDLTRSVEEAVELAERMGDPERVARAAIATSQGAIWQSAPHGQVHDKVIAALRRSLDRLPPEDTALRSRSMLALANHLYYASSFEERRALVDEALAMARRLDDDALMLDACPIAYVTLWSSSTAPERLGLATETTELARRLGSERAYVVGTTLRATALSELGRPKEMFPLIAEARSEAERLRFTYAQIVLDSLELPWLAMMGRFEECDTLLARIGRLDAEMSLEQSGDAASGALISYALWAGHAAVAAPEVAKLEDGPLPLEATVIAFFCRGGEVDRAREYYATRSIDLEHDDWFSMLCWCNAAEAAAYLDDPGLGADVYRRLTPYAGRTCSAGSGNASGPVDAFLALAASSVGERGLATRHADDAARLCQEWEIPLAAQWLSDQRDRFGF